MITPSDLIAHAHILVGGGPVIQTARPSEVDLRRAVSVAYYAMFHRLTKTASAVFAGSGPTVQQQAARAFNHAGMRKVCEAYVRNPAHPFPLLGPLTTSAPDGRLVSFAALFAELQDARHQADYDIGGAFAFDYAGQLVRRATEALGQFSEIEGQVETNAFLTALLLADRWTRRG